MKNILTQEGVNRIDQVCEQYNIVNYSINSDGSIDVDGNVCLHYKQLSELLLKFGKVSGNFDCSINYLTSIEGCPSSIDGAFYCYKNLLPNHFMNLYIKLSPDEFKIFIKYQHDLRIWEGEYNEEAAQDLFDEIKDGMH